MLCEIQTGEGLRSLRVVLQFSPEELDNIREQIGGVDPWKHNRQRVLDAISEADPTEGITERDLLRKVCMESTALEQVLNTLRLEETIVIHRSPTGNPSDGYPPHYFLQVDPK